MTIELGILLSLCSFTLSFVATYMTQKRASRQELEKKAGVDKLIEYQLKELQEDVKKILSKLDYYDKDVDERIEKAMEHHIAEYHKKGD